MNDDFTSGRTDHCTQDQVTDVVENLAVCDTWIDCDFIKKLLSETRFKSVFVGEVGE